MTEHRWVEVPWEPATGRRLVWSCSRCGKRIVGGTQFEGRPEKLAAASEVDPDCDKTAVQVTLEE